MRRQESVELITDRAHVAKGMFLAMGMALVLGMAASCSTGRRPLFGNGGDDDTGGTGGDDGTGRGGAPASNDGGSDGGSDAWVPPPPSPLGVPPREALTRVARVLWEALPDSSLVDMADSGGLETDADVRALARAMLDDPRARVGVGHFYRWWLGLEALPTISKDPRLFPEYSGTVGAMMAKETETFGVYTTLDADGRFPTLMQASYSFVNETLAPLYGLADIRGSDLRKVDLDPKQRAGIFTRLAPLTLNAGFDGWTSPSSRGATVMSRVLCVDIPIEPPDTPPLRPDPQYTNRELITRSAGQATCAPCHAHMDPVGFAYEGFDSIGRIRTVDAGKAIDTSGDVLLPSGRVDFTGPAELAQILATAPEAHRCMGSQWLAYMLGRTLNANDASSVEDIAQRFAASGLDLRTAIAAAASSVSFLDPRGGTPCTPGADQTCNANAALSSFQGRCGADGKCVCKAPATLVATTGRCL